MIGCPEERRAFRSWLELTWARIVASGDPKHVEAGTEVTAVRSYGGVMAYVASYISKQDQTLPGNFTGRYWGILNRAHLPTVPATTYEVTERQAVQINRWKRTLTRKYQEQARWNTWAKLWKNLPGNYGWFSRTEFEYAWIHRNRPKRCSIDLQTSTGCFLLPINALLPAMSTTDANCGRRAGSGSGTIRAGRSSAMLRGFGRQFNGE